MIASRQRRYNARSDNDWPPLQSGGDSLIDNPISMGILTEQFKIKDGCDQQSRARQGLPVQNAG